MTLIETRRRQVGHVDPEHGQTSTESSEIHIHHSINQIGFTHRKDNPNRTGKEYREK